MTNYKQPGNVLTFVAPSGGVTSGTPVLIEDLLVIPAVTAAEGVSFSGQVVGVFTLAKTTGEEWAVGQALYWVSGTSKLSTTAGGNLLVGTAAAAAGSAATTGDVRLDGVARP